MAVAVVHKVFFVNGDSVEQKIEIAPSKRAITKRYEQAGLEILKQVSITEQYMFTIKDVMSNKMTAEQKELLEYILLDAGIPADKTEEKEDGNENN